MLSILKEKLPAPESEVRAALATYQAELEAHAQTVGQPAPWPAFEVLREIVARGGEFVVVDSQELESPDLSVEHMQAAVLTEARAQRAILMSRFDGLQASALTTGNTAQALEIEGVKTSLRNMTADVSLDGLTTFAQMRRAFSARWNEIRAPLSGELKRAFAALDS